MRGQRAPVSSGATREGASRHPRARRGVSGDPCWRVRFECTGWRHRARGRRAAGSGRAPRSRGSETRSRNQLRTSPGVPRRFHGVRSASGEPCSERLSGLAASGWGSRGSLLDTAKRSLAAVLAAPRHTAHLRLFRARKPALKPGVRLRRRVVKCACEARGASCSRSAVRRPNAGRATAAAGTASVARAHVGNFPANWSSFSPPEASCSATSCMPGLWPISSTEPTDSGSLCRRSSSAAAEAA